MPDAAVESQVEQANSNGTLPETSAKIEVDELRQFYLTGRKSEVKGKSKTISALSSVFKTGLRNLEKMRIDFPLILTDDPALPMLTLPQFIDDLIAKLDASSDDAEELQHYLYLVERAIREKCIANSMQIDSAWKKAVKDVVKSAKIGKKKKEQLENTLKSFFKKQARSADVLAFNAQVIQEIFSRTYTRQAANTHAKFLDESRELLIRVSDILKAEYEKSEAAHSPQELANRLASDEIKPDTFSSLLAHAGKLDSSQKRNARLQLVKEKLTQLVQELESGELAVAGDFKTAFRQYETALKKFIAFYRARQIAKLEVANRYDAQKHDAYFEKFDLINIPVADLSLIWPAVIYLKQSKLTPDQLGGIARLAATEAPVKVILEFDRNLETSKAPFEAPLYPADVPRLLRGMLQETGVYVAQIPLSNFTALHTAFENGLQFNGPAIWGIYTGDEKDTADRYKQVYGANLSRVIPAFVLDHGKGLQWAEKFSLVGNEHAATDWPGVKTSVADENDLKIEVETVFTAIDFLSEQPAFSAHCFACDAAAITDDFIPAAEAIGKDSTGRNIPYVIKYDKKGKKYAVIVSQFLMNTAVKLLSYWQNLQELAGIKNSHVLAQMQVEQEKLNAALAAKENELEESFQAKLDSALGSLADEIVGNIAAGLLGQATAPVAAPVAAKPAVEKQSVSQAVVEDAPAPEVEAEAEDDDDMSFDAAYIDTPLCTSCNECVQRNSMIFAYDGNQQATIKDAAAGPFRDIVEAAEKCPVKIIHPGKPLDSNEGGLADLIKRAAPFN